MGKRTLMIILLSVILVCTLAYVNNAAQTDAYTLEQKVNLLEKKVAELEAENASLKKTLHYSSERGRTLADKLTVILNEHKGLAEENAQLLSRVRDLTETNIKLQQQITKNKTQ